jgi:hypothetical protein
MKLAEMPLHCPRKSVEVEFTQLLPMNHNIGAAAKAHLSGGVLAYNCEVAP